MFKKYSSFLDGVWVLLFLTAVAAPALAQEATSFDGIAINDVLRALEDNLAALKGYQVELQVQERKKRLRSTDTRGDIVTSASVVYQSDATGRVRSESQAKVNDGDKRRDDIRVAVFDGEVVRSVDGETTFNAGDINKQATNVFYHGLNPREFLTHVRNMPAHEFLASRNADLVGESTWSDRTVIVLETQPISNDGKDYMTRVMVDPERGFTIVKTAECFRFPPDGEWTEYVRFEAYDHSAESSGLWLPRRAVHEGYATPVSPEYEPKLLRRRELTFANWEINPRLPESTFVLDFPSGVIVDDEVGGRTFKAAQIDDQLLADHAALWQNLEDPSGDRAAAWRSRSLILILLGVALLAVVIVFAVKRR